MSGLQKTCALKSPPVRVMQMSDDPLSWWRRNACKINEAFGDSFSRRGINCSKPVVYGDPHGVDGRVNGGTDTVGFAGGADVLKPEGPGVLAGSRHGRSALRDVVPAGMWGFPVCWATLSHLSEVAASSTRAGVFINLI